MKKQEITRAIDLIAHFYATSIWYDNQKDIEMNKEKAIRESYGAEAIEWLLSEANIKYVIHRSTTGRPYAISTRIGEDSMYIRWIASTVHPWDEISYDYFKEDVEELRELWKVFTTDGCKGMKEI